MPAESIEHWMSTGLSALINGQALRPVEHQQMKGIPFSVQRAQAESYLLIASDGSRWILKKFHNGRSLDRSYLEWIARILPDDEGFRCGTARQVLTEAAMTPQLGCYHSAQLARWLEGTVLMPRIDGIDWACLADSLRDGSVQLDLSARVGLCRNLSRLVMLLEQAGCAHRDLSSGNVFFLVSGWQVVLIDFDSLYHPRLPMPSGTTCGTAGYTPHYVWCNGNAYARASWCAGADRYALSLLNVEFLVVGPKAPLTGEGGIFSQDELAIRRGSGLNQVRQHLQTECPDAVPLLDRTINSRGFQDCPSPLDWQRFCDGITSPAHQPPRLDDLEAFQGDYFEQMLKRLRPAAPIWPAPSLGELPVINWSTPIVPPVVVSLPPDPWNPRG